MAHANLNFQRLTVSLETWKHQRHSATVVIVVMVSLTSPSPSIWIEPLQIVDLIILRSLKYFSLFSKFYLLLQVHYLKVIFSYIESTKQFVYDVLIFFMFIYVFFLQKSKVKNQGKSE